MQKARLDYPGKVAPLGNRLVVDDDLLAQQAVVNGEVRLAAAQIDGMVGLDGATLRNESHRALSISGIRNPASTVEAPASSRGLTAEQGRRAVPRRRAV